MRFAGEVRFLRVLRFSGEARRWMKCSMKIMNYSRLTMEWQSQRWKGLEKREEVFCGGGGSWVS